MKTMYKKPETDVVRNLKGEPMMVDLGPLSGSGDAPEPGKAPARIGSLGPGY